jgi:methanol metabolism-related c-type cytochrome
VNKTLRVAGLLAAGLCLSAGVAYAIDDGSGDPTAVKSVDGKWFDKNGRPTFKIEEDGTVDWYTYVGFTRYSANCLRCHGPDGLGSSYGPALADSLKRLDYVRFAGTVAAGRQNVSASQDLVMPSLGNNKNVMCYLDAIYTYLRARADGAVDRGRPEKHAPKPAAFTESEDKCMG